MIKQILIEYVPYFPISLYLVFSIFSYSEQMKSVEDRRYEFLNSRMNTALTMVGFSFAVIGIVFGASSQNLSEISYPIYLFSLSLACYISSYVVLHFRMKKLFDTLSAGLINNGLWAIALGMYFLFRRFDVTKRSSYLFEGLVALMVVYIFVDLALNVSIHLKEKRGEE